MRLLFWLVFVITTVFSYNTLNYINEIVDGEVIVDGLTNTKCVAVSPDDRSVYVAGQSDNSLVVFTWDTITRKLAYNTRIKDSVDGIDGLYGVECITVSPDNKNVYTAGISAIVIFNRNTSTGALSYATTIKRGTYDLNRPRFITVSPDN